MIITRSPMPILIASMVALSGFIVSARAQAAIADECEAHVEALRREVNVPGIQIAVMRGGQLLWSKAFGYANLELKVPTTPQTRFRIASISKPLTSTGVAKLYERGLLDLDVPIRQYLPQFPDKGFPITTRQLLAHRSGIEHYRDEDLINTVHYPNMIAAMAKYVGRPLVSEPGKRHVYSSFGYDLIGAVIEGATGKAFTQYMQDSVFGPLGMRHTGPDVYADIVPERTAFYEIDGDGKVTNSPAVDNSDLWPAGGFLSTAEDLVRFTDAVVFGNFLQPKTRDLFLTPTLENLAEGQSYGYGWNTRSRDGLTLVRHGGSHFGARTVLVAYKELQMSVAVLVNASIERRFSEDEMAYWVATKFRDDTRRSSQAGAIPSKGYERLR